MKFLQRCALMASACLLAASAVAQPVTVADVKYEETASLSGSTLQLNGAGVRYKAVFKVYTAGLYLEKKAHTPQDIAALKGPKLIPGVLRMSQIFSDHKKLVAGDQFQIDWIPGTGTVITVKGKPQGEPFKEPEFFNALLGIWLGNTPADWKLKDALLGKPA